MISGISAQKCASARLAVSLNCPIGPKAALMVFGWVHRRQKLTNTEYMLEVDNSQYHQYKLYTDSTD